MKRWYTEIASCGSAFSLRFHYFSFHQIHCNNHKNVGCTYSRIYLFQSYLQISSKFRQNMTWENKSSFESNRDLRTVENRHNCPISFWWNDSTIFFPLHIPSLLASKDKKTPGHTYWSRITKPSIADSLPEVHKQVRE